MQEAGTVLHLARSGRLIIKVTTTPPVREGTVLVDEQGRSAGKVLEILGPASAPYLSAQPYTERIERIVGTKVFASDSAPQEFRNRKYSRRTGGSFKNDSPGKRDFPKSRDSQSRTR